MYVYPWTPAYNSPKMLRALKPSFQRGGGIAIRKWQPQRGEGLRVRSGSRKTRFRMSKRY